MDVRSVGGLWKSTTPSSLHDNSLGLHAASCGPLRGSAKRARRRTRRRHRNHLSRRSATKGRKDASAARAAANAMNGGTNTNPQSQANTPASNPAGQQALPPMQPGATMQAMANFQQAAAAAMQAAVQGMQGVPGLSLNALATPPGTNPQQAYNDTMTALAMQQAAAAAAAGQQFFQNNPFMAHPMMAWQNQQAAANAAAPGAVPQPAPEQSIMQQSQT